MSEERDPIDGEERETNEDVHQQSLSDIPVASENSNTDDVDDGKSVDTNPTRQRDDTDDSADAGEPWTRPNDGTDTSTRNDLDERAMTDGNAALSDSEEEISTEPAMTDGTDGMAAQPNVNRGESQPGGTATDDDIGPLERESRSTPSTMDVGLEDVALDQSNDVSQGLFDDLLAGEPIFENKEVLRPSYTPQELPHRSDQINRMATILVSALRGDTPSNILIYGKTGTGKTASAKFVSEELETTSQKYEVPCDVEYINCEVTDTQYRVLAQLANKFIEQNRAHVDERLDELHEMRSLATDDPGVLAETTFDSISGIDDRIETLRSEKNDMEQVPMTGWPTDRVYSVFFDAVDYTERVVVIMLDEIDKLVEKSGDDTLYNLSRMNSDLENSRVSIMGISNDLKFTDFLDPRVKSSLGEEDIVFPPYDANQLRDILQHRAEVAFEDGALSDDVIPLCAAFAAQEHGDARRALDLLRTAGELAERAGAGEVQEGHVRQAQDKIELDRVVEVVRTLPTQSKIVLFAIILLEQEGVQNVNTGEVYNTYQRLCDEIDADQLTQRRVTDLISELDMLGIVNAVVVSKGRYGRTKEISLSVPLEETRAVLLSDTRLGDVEESKPFVQARFDN